jgi:hypothetical protein
MSPLIEHQIQTINDYITYLEGSLKNPDQIDTTILKQKIRALKQVYRNAKGIQQQGYIMTSIEGMDMLEQDSSITICKTVIGANLFNLKWHLDYLKEKNK